MLGWLNAGAEQSVGFDQLRRASVKGGELAAAWGDQLTRFWQTETPYDFQKRIATSLPERRALTAVLSSGSGSGESLGAPRDRRKDNRGPGPAVPG